MLDVLAKIQNKLNVPKDQRNDFSNFNYRNCEDILSAAKPLLESSGITLILSDDVALVGDRYYVKASASLFQSDGVHITTAFGFAREEPNKKGMDAAQITGSASSYARKYALCALFLIDGNDDPDSQNNTGKEPSKFTNEVAILEAACASKDADLIKKTYGELNRDSIAEIWAELPKDSQEYIRSLL